MKKKLFMGSTEVAANKSIGEITSALVQSGARAIRTDYDKNGEVSGLYFMLDVNSQSLPFALPARVEPIFEIINGQRKYNRSSNAVADQEQAKRVAWRQILRWVEAQLALIQTGMVQPAEVFMPYLQTGPNETLYQRAVAGGFQKLLPGVGETVTIEG